MVRFTTTIRRYGKNGDKTGWTFIEIPAEIAELIFPGNRKTFRVKGKLDGYAIKGVALFPTGEGAFGLPLNAGFRKGIGKKEGAMIEVSLAIDKAPYKFNEEFMACLQEDEAALDFFRSLPASHQKYFNNWIDSAKTEPTRTKRIASALMALEKKQQYGDMIRALKKSSQ
jgi:Domain of unknown function (DUF1905)/Bacteriocin-protection, YdeI or OmpD-Associated